MAFVKKQTNHSCKRCPPTSKVLLLVESAFNFSILMMVGIKVPSMSKAICHNNYSFILGCLVTAALTEFI